MSKKHQKNPKPKISKSAATVLLILFCITVVQMTRFVLMRLNISSFSSVSPSRTKGDPKAPIRITEYIDFQCPACATGALLLKNLIKKYPSQIYLEVRYFPINKIHEHALKSAIYAECAARQNKFWPFEELLIAKQSEWGRLLDADSVFKTIAKSANLDLANLEACVNDDGIKKNILEEKTYGKNRGVNSTPTYFLNGKMLVGPKPLGEELNKHLGGKSH